MSKFTYAPVLAALIVGAGVLFEMSRDKTRDSGYQDSSKTDVCLQFVLADIERRHRSIVRQIDADAELDETEFAWYSVSASDFERDYFEKYGIASAETILLQSTEEGDESYETYRVVEFSEDADCGYQNGPSFTLVYDKQGQIILDRPGDR